MTSATTKKLIKAATQLAVQQGIKELPRIATILVKRWNQQMERGEMEKARAAIHVEFVKNRQVAAMIFEKYQSEMTPEVKSLYQEVMGEFK